MDPDRFDAVKRAHYRVKREKLRVGRGSEDRSLPGAVSRQPRAQSESYDNPPVAGVNVPTVPIEAVPSPPVPGSPAAQFRCCVLSLAEGAVPPGGELGLKLLRDAVAETVADLVGHVGAYMEIAQKVGRSVDMATASGSVSREMGPDNTPELVKDLQGQVRHFRRQIVQSAIKQGSAAVALADMRKAKDQAFLTAQQDIVATERRCEAELDKCRAEMKKCRSECNQAVRDKSSHVRWVQEELAKARAEIRWLREELFLTGEARTSAVEEAQQLRETLGGENKRLEAAFSWAQRRYTTELEKSAVLRAELERAEAVICGLQKKENLEVIGLRSDLLEPAIVEPEISWDSE